MAYQHTSFTDLLDLKLSIMRIDQSEGLAHKRSHWTAIGRRAACLLTYFWCELDGDANLLLDKNFTADCPSS